MLADAYKIASDIKQATPSLRNDTNVESFKTKIVSVQPLKQSLASIRHRFDICMPKNLVKLAKLRKYENIKHMMAVNECISDMIKFVDIVIDNTDVYDQMQGYIRRKISSVSNSNSNIDIGNIQQAAIKCIDIIEKHNKPK